MHAHHFHLELFKQRADELHREAEISRLVSNRPRRERVRVRETRVYCAVARRVWAVRGVPGLIP